MRPTAARYDPYLPEIVANPYPWYEQLRSDSPCHHLADPDVYVVSRYYDVVRLAWEDAAPPPAAAAVEAPPANAADRIAAVAAGFVDTMLDAGTFDLIELLARPFPLAVAEALGEPAGHGTQAITDAIGTATLTLMAHPLQWRAVQSEPGLVSCLVEECFRYEPPVQGQLTSVPAGADVSGDKIPSGSAVLLLFGSANRDPGHYPEPDLFEAARNPVDHLGFGAGALTCPGAELARMEAAAVAGAILQRVAAIRPAGPVERTTDPLTRGIASLPVTVEAR